MMLLESVRLARRCRDFTNAEELLLSLLRMCPLDAESMIAYGLFVLEVEKKVSLGMSYFEEVLNLHPGHTDALSLLAWIYAIYCSDICKANELLRQMSSLPTDCAMLWRLGDISWRSRNDFKSALFFYERALAADGEDPRAIASYAALLSAEQPKEAERLFLASLQQDEHDDNAHGAYGMLLAQTGRAELAKEHLAQAVELAPHNPSHLLELAKLQHFALNAPSDAAPLYERVMSLTPVGSEMRRGAMQHCATILHESRLDVDRAEQLYKTVLAEDPSAVPTLVQYAMLLQTYRRDYAQAERLYNKALRINSCDANALHGYAVLMHLVRRNTAAAKGLYERALVAQPGEAEIASHLAILLWQMRDMPNAERHFLQAMNEDHTSTVHYLNYVNFKHSKAKAALQWAGTTLVMAHNTKLLPTAVTLPHDWSEMIVEDCGSVPPLCIASDDDCSGADTRSPSPECSPFREYAEDSPMHDSSEIAETEALPPWMTGVGLSPICSAVSDLCGGQSTDLEVLFDSLPMMIPC